MPKKKTLAAAPKAKTPPTVPALPPKKPTTFPAIAVVLTLAVILVGSAIGVAVFRYSQTNSNSHNQNTTNNANTVNVANENTNTSTNANSNSNANTNTSDASLVTWHTMTAVKSLNLLPVVKNDNGSVSYDPNSSNETTGAGTNAAKYFTVGTVKSGTYEGGTVYMALWYQQGPQFYPTQTFWIKKGSTYTYPTLSNGYVPGVNEDIPKDFVAAGVVKQGVAVDTKTDLGVPTAPTKLTGPNPRQTLVVDTNVVAPFDATGLSVAFTDPTYGQVYWDKTSAAVDLSKEVLGRVAVTLRNGFYVKNPLGMMWVYRLDLDFMKYADSYNLSGVPQITWTNGKANKTSYDTTTIGGCGSMNYLDVTSGINLSDLKATGKTSKGDIVYEYANSNADALKAYYTDTYQVYGTNTKVSYATFVASHPMVFVLDPFSRLIRLTNDDFKPQVECGKPVIYLYPTTSTNVSVQLQPLGGFSKSVPAYGNGWNVTAQPDGTLTNLADGKTYPYLFWEGRGGIYQQPDHGFVVKQAEVHEFLVSSLAKLGLNKQETADFIEFWEPRMQGKPYYFVSFYGTSVMNQLAPLTITPKPDTIIRILMDYTPLEHPVTATPYTLTSIPRTGFTVVEWGGVLR